MSLDVVLAGSVFSEGFEAGAFETVLSGSILADSVLTASTGFELTGFDSTGFTSAGFVSAGFASAGFGSFVRGCSGFAAGVCAGDLIAGLTAVTSVVSDLGAGEEVCTGSFGLSAHT